jgi:hypothetical protein
MTGSRFLSKINVACRVVDILNNVYIASLSIYAARFIDNNNNNNDDEFVSFFFQGSMCIFCLLKMT